MSNTKYQAANQRDSFDEAGYTQAPPSYGAPSSAHDDADLLGGPRSSEDNIPDDFKASPGTAHARGGGWIR